MFLSGCKKPVSIGEIQGEVQVSQQRLFAALDQMETMDLVRCYWTFDEKRYALK